MGVALAGLSLWYLIVFQVVSFQSVDAPVGLVLTLRAMEIALLGGFSLVLIYAGYWLTTSQLDSRKVWWTGLWTVIGLSGVVALVALVQSFAIVQDQPLSQPTLVQELLLAAGGGGLAGLLIGISTVNEAMNAEEVKQQRDTLVFVNELLRHNVLNGMNVIQGNSTLLGDHVDEEGEAYLEVSRKRSEQIVELVQNVRVLFETLSGEKDLKPIDICAVLTEVVEDARDQYGAAEVELEAPDRAIARADELVGAVFENLLANAIDHNDRETPRVDICVDRNPDTVAVCVEDNGPGIPDEYKEQYFGPGEQDEDSVGQGIGLYLVDTLVDRYGGVVRVSDSEPRGAEFTVELQRPDS